MRRLSLVLYVIASLYVSDLYATPILISSGKPVTAGNYYNGYVPSNLTDGTLSTCWLNPAYNGWALIDLLEPIVISKVIFYDLVGGTVSGSNSILSLYIGTNQSTIDNYLIETKSQHLPDGVITPIEFAVQNITGRYVKMTISNSNSWVEGHEFEIYTNSVSVPEPVTVILFSLWLVRLMWKKIVSGTI